MTTLEVDLNSIQKAGCRMYTLTEKHRGQRCADLVFRLLFVGHDTPHKLQRIALVAADDGVSVSYVDGK